MLDLAWSGGVTGRPEPAVPAPSRLRLAASIREDPFRYLLLLRLAGYNLAAAMLLSAAFLQGWIETIIAADTSGLVLVITAIFVVGLVITARRATQISRELNEVRSRRPSANSRTASFLAKAAVVPDPRISSLESALKLRTVGEIAQIRHLANSLVLLGLIGTILGFVLALSAVDPEQAGDVAAVTPMISGLIEGLGVALYTTLVGATLNIWLMLNYRILEGGAARWVARLTERSASDARA